MLTLGSAVVAVTAAVMGVRMLTAVVMQVVMLMGMHMIVGMGVIVGMRMGDAVMGVLMSVGMGMLVVMAVAGKNIFMNVHGKRSFVCSYIILYM